jgi:alkylation response protein AidB-like acyl-CoA dehydrogenase
MSLPVQFRRLLDDGRLNLPFPGCGDTPRRHWELAQIARGNLELGRLVEAHADAVAILHEAGREPKPHALYGVWASEGNAGLKVSRGAISGQKAFCTGAGLVDSALVTVIEPERRLVEIDLRVASDRIRFDASEWATDAFAGTCTATALFRDYSIDEGNFIGPPGWYLERPGFWHGACGPASCWAGGAQGLIDYALKHARETNSHAVAHLGALHANGWQLQTLLKAAGEEIDKDVDNAEVARVRALSLRHLVEQSCTEIMLRFGRALGPRPLAFDARIARRCHELSLYIRQSHAETDLEELGRKCLAWEKTSHSDADVSSSKVGRPVNTARRPH